jgi:hypothetical protein
MDIASMSTANLIGSLVGFTLTIAVLSYLFGDNILFRFSLYLFIGVASGLAAVVTWYNVIWHHLVIPLLEGGQSERLFAIVPLLLSAILLLKLSPRLARFGNPAVAYLVGVGIAAAVGGALTGTLLPQFWASIDMFSMEQLFRENFAWEITKASVILLGTMTTLAYFHYGVKAQPGAAPQRPAWLNWLAQIGQIFIAFSLGALFSGVILASLTAFIERMVFIRDFVFGLLQLQ